MTMDEMLALPGVNVADLFIISELQKSIKAKKVISYLSGKTEAREEPYSLKIPHMISIVILSFPNI